MLGGLIAGALTGAAKGIGEASDVMLAQQNKLDLAKAMSDMEEEKLLRMDDVKRGRDISGIGKTAQATADAAPIVAIGNVAGQVATEEAVTSSDLLKKQANNKVAGQVANLNATKTAGVDKMMADAEAEKELAILDAKINKGVPQKQATLKTATLKADEPNVIQESTVTAKAKVAQVKVPGFLDAIAKEDVAKSAGNRSVANITANAPKISALADGTFAVTQGGKVTSYLTDPVTKEKIKGPKDLDSRTTAMVNALLLDAKADLDPDSRKETVRQAIDLIRGVSARPTQRHIDELVKDPSKAADFDMKFGAGASKTYLK